MKEAKVNVPVLLWVFVRPEQIKQVFDVLKEARPSILFLVSDGPRKHVPSDNEKIAASRKVVEDIDWDCQVHRLYFEENQGIFPMHKITCDYIFKKVDRCIFLEDDIIPSVSYFTFCEVLLEKYKDDLRVNLITGMNHFGVYDELNSDYFFTKAASVWGLAFWRRTYENFYNVEYAHDEYVFNRLVENITIDGGKQGKASEYLQKPLISDQMVGFEYFLGLTCFSQNQLSIVPKKNMICNIGLGLDSANTKSSSIMRNSYRNLFNMKVYDCDFPLKHPQFVVEDKYYHKIVYYLLDKIKPALYQFKNFDDRIWNIYFDNKIYFLKRIKRKIMKVISLES